jgi:hypothetical protein
MTTSAPENRDAHISRRSRDLASARHPKTPCLCTSGVFTQAPHEAGRARRLSPRSEQRYPDGVVGQFVFAHGSLCASPLHNRRSFATSFWRRSTRLGTGPLSGSTAIVIESLWTSRPR